MVTVVRARDVVGERTMKGPLPSSVQARPTISTAVTSMERSRFETMIWPNVLCRPARVH